MYIGQTGRPFIERFKEHEPTKNLDSIKSNYAKHIIDNDHFYTNIKHNMKLIKPCKKGKSMNAYEEFFIYKEFKNNHRNMLNDQLKYSSNYLFDTALNELA